MVENSPPEESACRAIPGTARRARPDQERTVKSESLEPQNQQHYSFDLYDCGRSAVEWD